MRPRILAAIAALVIVTSAQADTLDVRVASGSTTYFGEWTALDQVGPVGVVKFIATDNAPGTIRPKFSAGTTAPFGDFALEIQTENVTRYAEHCQQIAVTHFGGDTRLTFGCTEVLP